MRGRQEIDQKLAFRKLFSDMYFLNVPYFAIIDNYKIYSISQMMDIQHDGRINCYGFKDLLTN